MNLSLSPLPVIRERVRVRVRAVDVPHKGRQPGEPSPRPLPQCRERERAGEVKEEDACTEIHPRFPSAAARYFRCARQRNPLFRSGRLVPGPARQNKGGTVDLMAVHSLVTATRNPEYLKKINQFDVVAPDGQPVRWALNRLHKANLADRVYGPEFTIRMCAAAAEAGVPIYLYGSSPEVIELLQKNLLAKYPTLKIAGAESPPFRPLTPEEDAAVIGASTPAAQACVPGDGLPEAGIVRPRPSRQHSRCAVVRRRCIRFPRGKKEDRTGVDAEARARVALSALLRTETAVQAIPGDEFDLRDAGASRDAPRTESAQPMLDEEVETLATGGN